MQRTQMITHPGGPTLAVALLAWVLVLSVPALDAGYVQRHNLWLPDPATELNGWFTMDLSGPPFNVPADAVLEVLVGNSDPELALGLGAHFGGVRAEGSLLDRRIELHQADGGGSTYVTMHVQANSSSEIEFFAETADVYFGLIGYWDAGAVYEEEFSSITPTGSGWQTQALSGVGATEVAEIVMTNRSNDTNNDANNAGRWAGARKTGSALDRRVLLDNPATWSIFIKSGDGENAATLFVEADGLSEVELYADNNVDPDITFYLLGSFTTPPGSFVELAETDWPTSTGVGSPSGAGTYPSWEAKDLSAWVPPGSVAEILVGHSADADQPHMGVRSTGSSTDRSINHHDAGLGSPPAACCEDDGQFARMHVSTDGAGAIEWSSDSVLDADDHFLLSGYWYEMVIDGDVSEWGDGDGNEVCAIDTGGIDDWTSPSTLDITRFCAASDRVDTLYLLLGFDDATLNGGNTATACVLVDSDLDGNNFADYLICVVIQGPGSTLVDSVELYACDDTAADGCPNSVLQKTYTPPDYALSNDQDGPFATAVPVPDDDPDSAVEVAIPWSDLGLSGSIFFSNLISYPGKSFLVSPKDSIFGLGEVGWIEYDLDTGVHAQSLDWGDLPDGFHATFAASNGPRHDPLAVPNVYLGATVDAESNGQPNATATGDDTDLEGDDDDGVSFDTPLNPGNVADITVTASGTGVLNAWIDFNSDGDFADAGEQIATDLAVAAGANLLDDIPVPAGATGIMAARFRVTKLAGQGGGGPTGRATTGEVEDYVLAVLCDLVWNDTDNADGVQDVGEFGVAGVVVNLMAPDGVTPIVDGAGVAITTTTDANGRYEFPGLLTSSYRVRFDLPPGFADFSPRDQTTEDLDSDAAQLAEANPGLTPLVSLTAGQTDFDVDAGLRAVTAALITSAAAYVDGGEIVFEFSTGYEALSAGFEVYRYDASLKDYAPVTERLLPALIGAPQGGVYRIVDSRAPFSEKLEYVVVERQGDGGTQVYGPFTVTVGERGDRQPLAESFAMRPHVSQRSLERTWKAERLRSEAAVGLGGRSVRAGVANRAPTAQSMLLDVRETGLYFVSASQMAAVLGVAESKVRFMVSHGGVVVENGGEPVAWVPAGTSGQGLYFYGEAIDSLYTFHNTYRLRIKEEGLVMERVAKAHTKPAPGGSFSSTECFEEEVIPAIVATTETEVDHWFWAGINAGSSNPLRSFEVAVPNAVGGPAVLTARFHGATNGSAVFDHHAIVRVNGVEIGTAAWGGMEAYRERFELDGSLLDSPTTIEVEGVLAEGSTESIFFIDGFDLAYQRSYRAIDDRLLVTGDGNQVVTVEGFAGADLMVLDLTDPAAPMAVGNLTVEVGANGFQVSFAPRTANTPYFVTTRSSALQGENMRLAAPAIDLRAPHHRYEHVVIAPEAWRSEAERLASHRTSERIDSLAVSIEDVYDAFSDGIVTPWAIRDFLAYARENWSRGPDFAVLAGRGTFDPRDILGGGDNYLPVVQVGTPFGLQSSDNVLADLEGGDSIPEVAIGRLPIVGAGELATYVDKLEAYASSDGEWRDRALMLADNPDSAGDFPGQSDAVAAILGSYSQQFVYLSEMTPAEARAELQTAWNGGAQLVNYVGHGGVMQLAAENLLGVGDMDALVNGDRLPIVSALTCVVGRSDIPNFESLAEALVTDADGGAIVVWAPSGLSFSGAAHELNLIYASTLERAEADSPLGKMILKTLKAFGSGGGSVQMLDAYGITGDPAVSLP